MSRALPPPPRMPRAERLRLQQERAQRLRRKRSSLLLRALLQQRELLSQPTAFRAAAYEMRGLIAAARNSTEPKFEYGGRLWRLRKGLVFSTISTLGGQHIVTIGGEIFRE